MRASSASYPIPRMARSDSVRASATLRWTRAAESVGMLPPRRTGYIRATMKTQPDRGPLTGIRVIELADEQAEYCGLTLAGLGADVIKVEPPGGSPTRRIGPFYGDREDPERSLFFWQYNRGKRSIVLDLRRRDDRERFRALVATADVLLEATPKGELDALGLGAAALLRELPTLIVARTTPFGDEG